MKQKIAGQPVMCFELVKYIRASTEFENEKSCRDNTLTCLFAKCLYWVGIKRKIKLENSPKSISLMIHPLRHLKLSSIQSYLLFI